MKKIIVIAMGVVITLGSTVTFAESEVKEAIILNKSLNQGNATIAVGKDNLATTGSVNVKDSKVEKAIILNQSQNQGNATIAVGEGNTASTGSVTVE